MTRLAALCYTVGMPATETTSAVAAFARQIELAETKARYREIADEISQDLISRRHRQSEHEALTGLRIEALSLARKARH